MAPDQEIPLFRRAVAAKTTRIMDLRCKNKKNMDFPSLFILLLGNVSMLIIRADFWNSAQLEGNVWYRY